MYRTFQKLEDWLFCSDFKKLNFFEKSKIWKSIFLKLSLHLNKKTIYNTGNQTKKFSQCPLLLINRHVYMEILAKAKPKLDALHSPNGYILQQDGATSHTAKDTISFMKKQFPKFLKPTEWPPNSPDLNVMDYYVWGALQQMVYEKKIIGCFETSYQSLLAKAFAKYHKFSYWSIPTKNAFCCHE